MLNEIYILAFILLIALSIYVFKKYQLIEGLAVGDETLDEEKLDDAPGVTHPTEQEKLLEDAKKRRTVEMVQNSDAREKMDTIEATEETAGHVRALNETVSKHGDGIKENKAIVNNHTTELAMLKQQMNAIDTWRNKQFKSVLDEDTP